MHEGLRAAGLASALILLVLVTVAASLERPTLDKCAELVRDRPDDLDSYLCYWLVARNGEWGGATRALEALLAIDPSNNRAKLYLAAIEDDLGHERAERLYREAADGFKLLGMAKGEVYARLSLCGTLNRLGKSAEARHEVARAAMVAEQAADQPELRARAWTVQAWLAMADEKYGLALKLLHRAEGIAFPGGPSDLRSGILSRLGYAYWAQGLHARALEVYAREAELMRELGATFLESSARYNIALLSAELLDTERLGLDEHVRNVESALEMAMSAGNRRVEARTRLLLARALEGGAKVAEIRQALAISRELGNRSLIRETQLRLAGALWYGEPRREQEALGLLEEAIEGARSSGSLTDLAHGLIGRAGMLQERAPRDEWVGAYESALEIVERIRDVQPDGTVGARLFSKWVHPYYRFAAELLDGLPASPDPDGDLDLAYRTVERMRSRVLLDELDTAGAHPRLEADDPAVLRRAEVLQEIAGIQKRLADPALPADERSAELATLESLESEEEALRQEIAGTDPGYAALRTAHFPDLEEVQERLASDQAILSYQVLRDGRETERTDIEGGSWVIRITRDEAAAFPLPETSTIEDRVAVFLGLCRRRDGSEAEAAEVLYTDLLGEPLHGIDPAVRRLIIVPDGCLHQLPFAALRRYPHEAPLGVTHEIAQVPSVRLWMRWLGAEGPKEGAGSAASVLAFADPESGHGAALDERLRTVDPWTDGLQLGPLPHARTEANLLVRAARGAGRVVCGGEASERLLKQIDLSDYHLLHFSAHALVDYHHPERSAIVLAPGEEGEDGFLQMREILELDLADKVVILSACRSASGTVLQGEGTLGLARAFFQAGARAVVGNLWPMRDDEAEALMEEFSRRLARGQTLSRALAGARAVRIEAGAPAAAWAGLVVLGDGDVVPIPGKGGRFGSLLLWGLAALGAVLLAGVALLSYRGLRS